MNTVRRSFQDIQDGLSQSMQSLLEVGSALGHRMMGMIAGAPRLLSSGVASLPHPGPSPPHHQQQAHPGSGNLPPYQYHPVSENLVEPDPYNAPVAPAGEAYGYATIGDSYGSPLASPVQETSY